MEQLLTGWPLRHLAALPYDPLTCSDLYALLQFFFLRRVPISFRLFLLFLVKHRSRSSFPRTLREISSCSNTVATFYPLAHVSFRGAYTRLLPWYSKLMVRGRSCRLA